MVDGTAVVELADLSEAGTHLFTVEEPTGREEEVLIVMTDDGVAAWKNFCMHEPDQRLHRGGEIGAAIRDDQIICPRHGSMFDASTGNCGNGPAAGQSLVPVDVTIDDATVYLTADGLTYLHEGGIDDDDLPDSTSHLSF